MTIPPRRHRDHFRLSEPRWSSIILGFAMFPVLLLGFWVISNPVATGIAVVTLTTTGLVARHTVTVDSCVRECCEIMIELAGSIRVTIGRPAAECTC